MKHNGHKKSHNFDFDDNVLDMPTYIIYFNKEKDAPIKEIPVSTANFALTRLLVGVENYFLHYKETEEGLIPCEKEESTIVINVKDYEVINEKTEEQLSKMTKEELASYDKNKVSFRQFRDCEVNEYFMRDLKTALANKKFAPSWNDFVEACSTPESVENLTIITARGQSPKTLHKGLKYLQSEGYIKYCPHEHNMFPVSYSGLPKEFTGGSLMPSEAKKNVMAAILDRAEKDSKISDKRHSVGFSDDDKKTFDVMFKFLSEQVNSGRWLGVEIYLYFTGNKTKERFVLHKKDSVA